MKIDVVYSYDVHSESARMIADELGVKVLKHEGSNFKGNPQKTVLNWGCSDLPREVRACRVINPENGIRMAVNKLFTMRALSTAEGVTLPEWTTDPEVAGKWEGKVYCRGKLTGHDGDGITLVPNGLHVVPAKLYTRQIGPPKDLREYRINIFRDSVVTRQKKVRVRKWEGGEYNDEIKTTNGGYGFDIVDQVPLGVIPLAKKAVASLGLDFGGVDVVVYRDVPYVLEVNTAPQLTPYTCKRLATLLKDKE